MSTDDAVKLRNNAIQLDRVQGYKDVFQTTNGQYLQIQNNEIKWVRLTEKATEKLIKEKTYKPISSEDYTDDTGVYEDLEVSKIEQVKDLQYFLKNLGVYTGSIDGIIGRETKIAIKEVEKYYDASTVKRLNEYIDIIKGTPEINSGKRVIKTEQNFDTFKYKPEDYYKYTDFSKEPIIEKISVKSNKELLNTLYRELSSLSTSEQIAFLKNKENAKKYTYQVDKSIINTEKYLFIYSMLAKNNKFSISNYDKALSVFFDNLKKSQINITDIDSYAFLASELIRKHGIKGNMKDRILSAIDKYEYMKVNGVKVENLNKFAENRQRRFERDLKSFYQKISILNNKTNKNHKELLKNTVTATRANVLLQSILDLKVKGEIHKVNKESIDDVKYFLKQVVDANPDKSYLKEMFDEVYQ